MSCNFNNLGSFARACRNESGQEKRRGKVDLSPSGAIGSPPKGTAGAAL
jgi:hypothetical protein